jgi:hypothetical protein
MKTAIDFVDRYEGPNLLDGSSAAIEDEVARAYEQADSALSGQGFGGTAVERHAVEKHAMKAACRYFRRLGYQCDPSVHETKPYDVLARKRRETLYVEVKGTRGAGDAVILTRREVAHVKSNPGRCALFVLRGVRISGRGNSVRASGGNARVIRPWRVSPRSLVPLAYECTLA